MYQKPHATREADAFFKAIDRHASPTRHATNPSYDHSATGDDADGNIYRPTIKVPNAFRYCEKL